AGTAVVVAVGVAEAVADMLAVAQLLHRAVRAVDRVGVAAVDVEVQRAVLAGDILADGVGVAVHRGDRMAVIGVAVGVVGQHVAAGVMRAVGDDRGGIGDGAGRGIDAVDGDVEGAAAGGTVVVGVGVGEVVD